MKFKYTDETIKAEIINNRPEGFKMAFDKKAKIEENECLLKIKRGDKPFGRMLVSRIDGTTLLWIGEGMSKQKVSFCIRVTGMLYACFDAHANTRNDLMCL